MGVVTTPEGAQEYRCMSVEELDAWREAAANVSGGERHRAIRPCADCPMAYRVAEVAAGRCDRPPWPARASEQRIYQRDWMRAFRARQRAS